jgi:hypothetical protein
MEVGLRNPVERGSMRNAEDWADFMCSKCCEQSWVGRGVCRRSTWQSARASLSGEKQEMLGTDVEEGDT